MSLVQSIFSAIGIGKSAGSTTTTIAAAPPASAVVFSLDLFSRKDACASRRELHHKSKARADGWRALERRWKARGGKPRYVYVPEHNGGPLFAEYSADVKATVPGYDSDLGYCHRVWTLLAGFLAGRPYARFEQRPEPLTETPVRALAQAMSGSILECAIDPQLRAARNYDRTRTSFVQMRLAMDAEEAIVAWLKTPAVPKQ